MKFSYSGKVFQRHEDLRGLTNEHTQAGVEMIGYPVQLAVEEVLLSAKEALDVAKLDQVTFELSHAAILETVFESMTLADNELQNFKQAIQDKNVTGLKEFTLAHPSEFDGFISQLPFLFEDWKEALEQARKPVPYYTGLMFKVFGDKAPDVTTYVRHGVADLGVVGKDVLIEHPTGYLEMLDLNFGLCKFAVASTADYGPSDHKRKRIATKYPTVAKNHFAQKG